ncbi:PPOX class F420-dependent oxidoreductase [Enemella dayhoffiae]|nr:PPOX class F420-dependent oxidoreductase [Enemella dayhoffiae]
MSEAEVRDFLERDPARPAILGTTRKDGRPHLAPMWYALDSDGSICFNTGADTLKGRTLRRTGYAVLTVQDDRPPFSFVTVQGPVELVDDLEQVRRWAGMIGGRYMGADRAGEYAARNGVPGELLVRLRVNHTVSAADVAD